jgi:hypothetical protein
MNPRGPGTIGNKCVVFIDVNKKNEIKNARHCGDIGMINKCCVLWRERR